MSCTDLRAPGSIPKNGRWEAARSARPVRFSLRPSTNEEVAIESLKKGLVKLYVNIVVEISSTWTVSVAWKVATE